jgi:hypothetical protein
VRRITLSLPADLDARLRREAELRGTTIADVTREALTTHLSAPGRRVLLGAGPGRGGAPDVSAYIEAILANERGP